MQKSTGLILLFLCIVVMFVAGCASQPAPAPVTTTVATPVPTTAAPEQTSAPIATVATIQAAPITTVITTTSPATDPILHRWIREFFTPINGIKYGYEFKFYPGGVVNYREGATEQVSSNYRITKPTAEASGTWTALGDNKYLVKILPTGQTGAQLIREYTLVPAHEVKEYPGVVIPEHIESSYETEAIGKAHVQAYGEIYYPERAKID